MEPNAVTSPRDFPMPVDGRFGRLRAPRRLRLDRMLTQPMSGPQDIR
jgi:hypothetical protein